MRLLDSLPELSEELGRLLHAAGEPELAGQISGLQIVERCRCRDDFCSSFYTAPRPAGAYGPRHRNISLSPAKGIIILDVVDEKIMNVEVLYRDEVKSQLSLLFPES